MPYRIRTYLDNGSLKTIHPITSAEAVQGLGDAFDAYTEQYIDPKLDRKIEDVPESPHAFVRMRNSWVKVDLGSMGQTIIPPPADNKLYAMTGLGWIDITSAITIAGLDLGDFIGSIPATNNLPPADGKFYAMRNNMWVDITSVLKLA